MSVDLEEWLAMCAFAAWRHNNPAPGDFARRACFAPWMLYHNSKHAPRMWVARP